MADKRVVYLKFATVDGKAHRSQLVDLALALLWNKLKRQLMR